MIRSARAWRVLNIEIGLDEPESALRSRADSAVGIDSEQVRGLRIALRSVDVLRGGKGRCLRFIVHADLVVDSTFHGVVFDGSVHAGKVVEAQKVRSCRVIERVPVCDQGRVVYPIGEGAGYAGGIMSTSIDGVRSVLRYLRR